MRELTLFMLLADDFFRSIYYYFSNFSKPFTQKKKSAKCNYFKTIKQKVKIKNNSFYFTYSIVKLKASDKYLIINII